MNNLFFLIIFVPILAFILLGLNVLLAVHRPDESKVSAYECGFSPVYGQIISNLTLSTLLPERSYKVFRLLLSPPLPPKAGLN